MSFVTSLLKNLWGFLLLPDKTVSVLWIPGKAVQTLISFTLSSWLTPLWPVSLSWSVPWTRPQSCVTSAPLVWTPSSQHYLIKYVTDNFTIPRSFLIRPISPEAWLMPFPMSLSLFIFLLKKHTNQNKYSSTTPFSINFLTFIICIFCWLSFQATEQSCIRHMSVSMAWRILESWKMVLSTYSMNEQNISTIKSNTNLST